MFVAVFYVFFFETTRFVENFAFCLSVHLDGRKTNDNWVHFLSLSNIFGLFMKIVSTLQYWDVAVMRTRSIDLKAVWNHFVHGRFDWFQDGFS